MEAFIRQAWKDKNALFYLILVPLSWLFAGVTILRRWAYRVGLLPASALPVPVIVVGNINMGGSGKTPVVIWLVEQLKKHGYHPGVISRGYGTSHQEKVRVVQSTSLPADVGDEPLLIARRTGCPVWVGANRADAGRALLQANTACDVLISDDGLQHYSLKRDVEIAVVDTESASASCLLPAGSLREPQRRLKQVDVVLIHADVKYIEDAYTMRVKGETFYNLLNPQQTVAATHFHNRQVTALAGIGKPERFFNTLTQLGIDVEGVSFADHHAFTAQDLANIKADALIMTEKDAVKCQPFAQPHHWVLPVEADIDAGLLSMVLAKLNGATQNKGV